jgi:hypothetical protein
VNKPRCPVHELRSATGRWPRRRTTAASRTTGPTPFPNRAQSPIPRTADPAWEPRADDRRPLRQRPSTTTTTPRPGNLYRLFDDAHSAIASRRASPVRAQGHARLEVQTPAALPLLPRRRGLWSQDCWPPEDRPVVHAAACRTEGAGRGPRTHPLTDPRVSSPKAPHAATRAGLSLAPDPAGASWVSQPGSVSTTAPLRFLARASKATAPAAAEARGRCSVRMAPCSNA